MRTRLAAAAALALLALALGAAAPAQGSIVRGQIVDRTCYGPCYPDGEGRPFTGDAKVLARRAATGRRAGADAVERSRFSIRLPPGRYVVTVEIDDPCWNGDKATVRVQAGEHRRLRLEVANRCIL